MFSKEFKVAITNQVFDDSDINSFHDVVLSVLKLSLTNDELRFMFGELPEELQILALQWGLSDRQFCDDVSRDMDKFTGQYAFLINAFVKHKLRNS